MIVLVAEMSTATLTPLRELISESSPYLVIAELVDIIGELEEHAEGEEDYRWAQCGVALRRAKNYADEHWEYFE